MRILAGYLFLINVFFTVIMATGVLDMFYDFMALEFIQVSCKYRN